MRRGQVGADSSGEAIEFQGEVEPPTWVPLAEDDHQQRRHHEPTRHRSTAARDLSSGLGHGGLVPARRQQGEDEGDGYRPDEPKEGCQPVEPLGVVDLEAGWI